MKHAAAILLLTVSLAGAQSLKLRIDPAYPDQPLKTLPMLQAASPILDVYTYEDGVRQTNLTGHSAVWYYGTSAEAAAFAIMTNTSAGVGYFRFNVPAAKINTNGAFWSTVLWRNATTNTVYSGTGVVQIAATTVTGNPGELRMLTPLDFDLCELRGTVPLTNLPAEVVSATAPSLAEVLAVGNDANGLSVTNIGRLGADSSAQGALISLRPNDGDLNEGEVIMSSPCRTRPAGSA